MKSPSLIPVLILRTPDAPFSGFRKGRAGFSLVEVTLAIGIIAFAFVGLFALLPAGLTTFRQAMDTSVGAQIAQRIAGELQETDYATLLKNCTPPLTNFLDSDEQVGLLPRRYFDDQGNEVPVKNPASVTDVERLKILYEVIVRVSRARRVPASMPGGRSGRLGSKNLTTLTIQVANNPRGVELPLNSALMIDPIATPVSFQTYPALVARNSAEP
jgi:uncharacterized protein (TIGR02598 family)